MEIDWTWTAQESLILGLIGLGIFAIILLAYFRDKVMDWWRQRRRM